MGVAAVGVNLWALYCWQALVYSHLARSTPVAGLVTAIVGACLSPLLGSRGPISIGPSGAIAAIIGATLGALPREQAAAALAALAVLTGGFLLVAGALRVTFLQRLFPEPVRVGFLTGTGITVVVAQGAEMTLNGPASLLVGAGSIALLWTLKRLVSRTWAPFWVLALAASTGGELEGYGVRTLGSVSTAFAPASPSALLGVQPFATLVAAALSIAVLVSAHPLLAPEARIQRGEPGARARREAFALGAINLISGCCGGFAAGCSGSRTALGRRAGPGARHVAALAAISLILTLALSNVVDRLPIVTLSAILAVVCLDWIDAARLSEWRRSSPRDFRMALVAAFGVTLFGPRWGAAIGVAAAVGDLLWHVVTPRREGWRSDGHGPLHRALEAGAATSWSAAARGRRRERYRWVRVAWPPRRGGPRRSAVARDDAVSRARARG